MGLTRTNADAMHLRPGEVTPSARDREARIRSALRDGPQTAEEVVRRTGLSQPVVYAELSLLADCGQLLPITLYALPGAGRERG